MYNTYSRPSCDLVNNLSDVIQSVKEHDHILISHDGKEEAVLINAEDFAAYTEYLHTRYILNELAQAEKEAADPNTKWLTREEFFNIAEV